MRMIFGFIMSALLVGCSETGSPDPAAENTGTMTHYAQFRDPQQNRVVIFVFKEGTGAQEIRSHAQSVAYTAERLTAVYYFPEGDIRLPPTRLSRSGHVVRANDLMYDDPDVGFWHYVFLRPFVGEPRFSDCLATPEDVLCRQP